VNQYDHYAHSVSMCKYVCKFAHIIFFVYIAPMRLRVKGTTFHGQYMGRDTKTGKVRFLDEELGRVKLYPASKLVKAYDK